MNLIPDKKYILRFSVNGVTLTYHCTIDSIDENFVTFTDKFGKKVTYNLSNIISYEEVQDD
jgi:hypothetical protein